MAETYLHTLYPNLGPQIDEAIGAGYSLQETHDHISGKINEARRNGYQDDEVSEYIGKPIDTTKPRGFNPFLAQTYKAAKAVNESVATFTKGLTEPGQYISEKLGFGRSEAVDEIVASMLENYGSNADYWDAKAKEQGAGFVDEMIGEAVGAAPAGILDFMLGIVRAPVSGAAEAQSKGQSEIAGAITATAKRLALGKLFHEFNKLKKGLAAPAMAITGGVQAAAEGGGPREIAKSAAAMAMYSMTGRGTLGVKEIRDARSGKPRYEAEIRTVEQLEAEREKVREAIKEDDRAKAEKTKEKAIFYHGTSDVGAKEIFEGKVDFGRYAGAPDYKGLFLSTNKVLAESFADQAAKRGGRPVTLEVGIKDGSRIIQEKDLIGRSNIKGSIVDKADARTQWARDNGYDVISRPDAGEYVVINPDAVDIRPHRVISEMVPPTSSHLEYFPEEYPNIKSVAVKVGEEVYEARAGETTHVQVALSNGLDPDRSVSGYVTNGGEFVKKPGIEFDPYEKVAMENVRGTVGAEAIKPVVYRISHLKSEYGVREGKGVIFFGTDPEAVKDYKHPKEPSTAYSARLKYDNPYRMTYPEIEELDNSKLVDQKIFIDKLKEKGYDAIIEDNEPLRGTKAYKRPWQVAVFDKSQIEPIGAEVIKPEITEKIAGEKLPLGRHRQGIMTSFGVSPTTIEVYSDRIKAFEFPKYAKDLTYEQKREWVEDHEVGHAIVGYLDESTSPSNSKLWNKMVDAWKGDKESIGNEKNVSLHEAVANAYSKHKLFPDMIKEQQSKMFELMGSKDVTKRFGEIRKRFNITEIVGAEAIKPEVKAEDVGAAKARRETKLYGVLLEQQKAAEAKLDKLKGLATTNPAKVFMAGNVEALEDYAARVDRDVFEAKMKKLHPLDENSLWLQEGYESPGDFWDRTAGVSTEITKEVFDRNWSKVGTLAEDVDKKINKMIDTAEKMGRAAYESGDRIGMKREHEKMAELQRNRDLIRREHDRTRREVGSIVRRITKLSKAGNIDPDYRDHIQSILEDYDLHVRSKKVMAEREGTREFVARMEAQGETIYVPEEKLAMLRKKPLNDVSLDELRNLDDVIKSIAHQGALKKKLISMGKERDFQEVKQGLLDSIKENAFNYREPGDVAGKFPSERGPGSVVARFKRKIGEIAGATKVEYIFDKLDGFKGKMYEVKGKWAEMFDMRVRAENKELRLKEADVRAITAAIEPIKRDFPRMMSGTVEVDGRTLTRMEAVEIYWNSKNEGNRNALRKGFAMGDATIDRIVNTLTPHERAFADSIMTMIQEKGPDIAKTLRRLTGEKMKMEKSYFPLWFDWELSSRAAERQQGQDLLKQVYSKIGVERGFTVSRVGGAEAPYLSFDVVIKHLDRVNHFIANAQAVRDFQRMIFDPEIRKTFEANAGEGAYKEVVDWLKEWGNPRQSYMGNLDKWMGTLRHNATLAVLGMKVSTSILQPTAYAQLINRIGVKNAMVGLMDFYRHPRDNMRLVYELSPAMKSRSHTFDRDLKDFLDKDDYFSKWGGLKNHAMVMVSAMDLATTLPAWWSAYHLGMKKWGWNRGKSVEYADMVVRRTQASGMPKDMPGVLRGSNFKKIFTMFYTYFNSTYNEAARDVRAFRAGEESALDVARSFFWLFAVQAAVQTILRRREQGTLGEFGKELVGNVSGTIPYIGPIVNAMISGYDYQPSPVFEIPAELVAMTKAEKPEAKLKHAVMAAGYMAGFPSRQAILTAQYLWDVLEGRDYNPANLAYRKKEKKGGWK